MRLQSSYPLIHALTRLIPNPTFTHLFTRSFNRSVSQNQSCTCSLRTRSLVQQLSFVHPQIMSSSGALHVPASPAPTTTPTYGQRLSRSPSYMEVFGLADERCVGMEMAVAALSTAMTCVDVCMCVCTCVCVCVCE